ncbi:hypothetical protein Q8A67_002300 [Cirrhinus molitorella]|uniref:Uncharacterized protein n=1 Tax=Cirrhinus molitorella TaxID=172907 RepID=A0AA88U5V0_9TELE|nr:hypothetical protein Q8A67_002300 [Cirrhinus molitorella]
MSSSPQAADEMYEEIPVAADEMIAGGPELVQEAFPSSHTYVQYPVYKQYFPRLILFPEHLISCSAHSVDSQVTLFVSANSSDATKK